MISVNDECPDAGVIEAAEAGEETHLRPQAALCPVIDVARDDDE